MNLILATKSRYKIALFERLGSPFISISSGVDENEIKRRRLDSQATAIELARAKALSVWLGLSNDATADQDGAEPKSPTIVIGADQVADLDGELLDQPGSIERQIEQLTRLAGKTHILTTAFCLLEEGRVVVDEAVVARMTMRRLDESILRRYATLEPAIDCVGGYQFEGLGGTLFERVETDDPTSIVGLPMIKLTSRLLERGVVPFSGRPRRPR